MMPAHSAVTLKAISYYLVSHDRDGVVMAFQTCSRWLAHQMSSS